MSDPSETTGPVEEYQNRLDAARAAGGGIAPTRPLEDPDPLLGAQGVHAVGNMIVGDDAGSRNASAAPADTADYLVIVNGYPAIQSFVVNGTPRAFTG